MKIISWNVNGLKSIIENGYFEEILKQDPDILCLQEVKSTEIPEIENYISYNYPASELVNYMEQLFIPKLNLFLLGKVLEIRNLMLKVE